VYTTLYLIESNYFQLDGTDVLRRQRQAGACPPDWQGVVGGKPATKRANEVAERGLARIKQIIGPHNK